MICYRELLTGPFPDDLRALSKKLGDMPWLLYAPFFCATTTLRSKFRTCLSPLAATPCPHL